MVQRPALDAPLVPTLEAFALRAIEVYTAAAQDDFLTLEHRDGF
jgi:hypothetical protein